MTPKPYQQRVIDEKADLDEKIGKLRFFIDRAPLFESLPIKEQGLMRQQLIVMTQYAQILAERIQSFAV
jgi:hypothetical protein